jgi:toxin YoeB
VSCLWTRRASEDLLFWIENDRRVGARLVRLVLESERNPFEGRGKPEPLRGLGPDIWSRRITGSDRLVYRVLGKEEKENRYHLHILQARYHY